MLEYLTGKVYTRQCTQCTCQKLFSDYCVLTRVHEPYTLGVNIDLLTTPKKSHYFECHLIHHSLFNLWGTVDKLVFPEVVGGVFDELYERDKQPPGVRSVHNQPLQQNPGHLLLYGFNLGLREEGEEGTREVVGVGVGVPQLVGNGVEEEVATYTEEKQREEVDQSRLISSALCKT